jgi:predicted CXXCH cytochrome family protein
MKFYLKILIGALGIVNLAWAGNSPKSDQCLVCHEAMGDKPVALFKKDVHYQNGVTCAGCHGGDATKDDQDEAMKRSAGFLGVPVGDDISKACANCHSDSLKMNRFGSTVPTNQLDLLKASSHGKLSTTGKQRIAQCTTCHSAHGIVKVTNPLSPVYPLNVVKTCSNCHANAAFMRLYNPSLAVDQLDKYKTSVHGMRNAKGDFKAAVCSSCHGSHDIQPASSAKSKVYASNVPATCSHCHSDALYMKEYHIPTDQFEKFSKSVHGQALFQKHDLSAPACNDCHGNHGATPPGVESISKVCGTCHALNADLFSSSPHKKAFDENKFPECETCHGNHGITSAAVSMLGVDSTAVCSRCHTEIKRQKGYVIARGMRQLIDSLGIEEQDAKSLIEEAEQKGMEIGEAKFKLRDVHQARLESRTMVHSFNEKKFRDVVNKGLNTTSFVKAEAVGAVEEYFFRRWGLGISTLIITILAVSLFMYIKRIEQEQSQNKK